MDSFVSESDAHSCRKHSIFQLAHLTCGINKPIVSKMWLACPNTTDSQAASLFLIVANMQNITFFLPGPVSKVVFPKAGAQDKWERRMSAL